MGARARRPARGGGGGGAAARGGGGGAAALRSVHRISQARRQDTGASAVQLQLTSLNHGCVC
jgi:hypothetical protein